MSGPAWLPEALRELERGATLRDVGRRLGITGASVRQACVRHAGLRYAAIRDDRKNRQVPSPGTAAGRSAGGQSTVAKYGAEFIAARARKGLLDRFRAEVDATTPGLDRAERERRAVELRREHMVRISALGVEARRKKQAAA